MEDDTHQRGSSQPGDPLAHAIHHLRHLLPAQGPLGVFVHHNTLHAFEDQHFETATREAGRLYGAEPYLSLDFYLGELARGRITRSDLEAVLRDHAARDLPRPESVLGGRLPFHVFARVLLQTRPVPDDQTVNYYVEERRLSTRFVSAVDVSVRRTLIAQSRPWLRSWLLSAEAPAELFADPWGRIDLPELLSARLGATTERASLQKSLERDPEAVTVLALWSMIGRAVRRLSLLAPARPRELRLADALERVTGGDADAEVSEMLVPYFSAYLDQGLAYWPVVHDRQGMYPTIRALVSDQSLAFGGPLRRWRETLQDEAKRGLSARESILESLARLGHPESEWGAYLTESALALPGWLGMINRLEAEPELAPFECPPVALIDALALKLSADCAALVEVAFVELGTSEPPSALHRRLASDPGAPKTDHEEALAFSFLQLLELAGIGPRDLAALRPGELEDALRLAQHYDELERRRIFHLAYERNHRRHILEALARARIDRTVRRPQAAPYLQVMACMDDREESLRRHLEELDPQVETFGAAGFFGVAVAFRGIDDGYFAPLCPVVQKPEHRVSEAYLDGQERKAERYQLRRRLLALLAQGSYVSTRSLVRGFVATFGLGLFSLFPMASRVLAPRQASRIRKWATSALLPKPRTELSLERKAEELGSLELFPGFTLREMADRVERVLRDTGLVSAFSPLVIILGHGSSSLNNPLGSAYNCGACGGRRGGPNARLFASMANQPEVRAQLGERGLLVPEGTWFVGGYHDTSSDAVSFFDEHLVPGGLLPELERARSLLSLASARSAHERCRRFDSVPLTAPDAAALSLVEERSESLAEPRPELGHATNAMAFFGRRGLTKGLFLDRRAFLISYDPTIDPEAEILGRLLAANGPVGAGINLEYYFSRVDPDQYGCGTKLPHNVTGLLGIMNGSQSDLRTGLPVQMTEIHEPVRLLVICEATEEMIAKVAAKHPGVRRLVENCWIQLALVHPETGEVSELGPSGFVPIQPALDLPVVPESKDWYAGQRDHLPIALVSQAALH